MSNTRGIELPPEERCKCCGGPARRFGEVDFSKCCEDHRGKVFPDAGIPVPYCRCEDCGFLFTTAFDRFKPVDFLKTIYNDQYVLADPEMTGARARRMAEAVICGFAHCRQKIRVLDYGGGTGVLALCLRKCGFAQVETYDPFVARFAWRPSGVFDLVLSFEVVEHSISPVDAFRDMAGFLADPGIVMFSTLLVPADIQSVGTDWWYLAPRNGHVSLHTQKSLQAAAAQIGFNYAKLDESTHYLTKTCPDWARNLAALKKS